MKLSAEEWAEIDRITERLKDKWAYDIGTFANDCEYLLDIVQKLRPKSRERFTYEWRDCDHVHCDKGRVYFNGGWFKCQGCGGLGKVRVKVKSKAHNA